MNETRKQYKFNADTISKINKMMQAKQSENATAGIDARVYERDIVIQSIDYAYSAKFGKDVFDQTMQKLENVLGNMMQSMLDEYVMRLINVMNNLSLLSTENKEMLLLILKANDILPEDEKQIAALIMNNANLEDAIRTAVMMKSELKQ